VHEHCRNLSIPADPALFDSLLKSQAHCRYLPILPIFFLFRRRKERKRRVPMEENHRQHRQDRKQHRYFKG
jgi:hypothetical protein